MDNYNQVMKKCIALANKAKGFTSPNPLVGCVILDKNNEVVSSGYHHKYGEFHAERDALLKIDNAKDCTLVVNLEPCCHFGKTPPCTDIIIEKGIKTVVYGMKDPNPIVSGKGLEILRNNGINVIGPVLVEECEKLNEIFIKNKLFNKTFVALKTATTIDGKIATCSGDSKWITSSKARKRGKILRSYYDAILTSSSTIIADNPTMLHKNKIILDRNLKTDLNSNIYKQGNIYIFHDRNAKSLPLNTKYTFIPTPVKNNILDIDFVLDKLYDLGIMSIFVEAGGNLNASFLPYVDKLYHFIAPKVLGDNSGKSCFNGKSVDKILDCVDFKVESVKFLNPDVLVTFSKM